MNHDKGTLENKKRAILFPLAEATILDPREDIMMNSDSLIP